MLMMVIGFDEVSANELPREDLTLCDDPGRVALQAILPKCDAKGILKHASGRALGPMRILGVDDDEACQDSGVARAQGPALEGVLPTPGTREGQASALGA
ncbi:hypothetical protein E2562_038806 [Oryza meyeriana var. granulata]|uniref:Uncharacterized protein n=1 Tax=Oryza meyeriana var. granulata TaxID=110450 RepID=A0A6G1FGQ6_9ORYZ|nr:hypothetical protein E2562_038806 [Oryza meyeriana var. granulata]